MYKIMFAKNNEFFIITIDNKKILYYDKLEGALWGGPLQYLPPDPEAAKKIAMSRNKIPVHFINMLKIPKEELAEFENAKDDDELKELVIRDCRHHGCKMVDIKTA